MSNIFEIDGEIEDNDDDNQGKKGGEKNPSNDEDQGEAVENSDSSESDEVSESSDEYSPYSQLEEETTPLSTDPESGYGDDDDFSSVDEVTEEEIEEVLAEIDESERILAEEEHRFDEEETAAPIPKLKHTHQQGEESFDDIFPKGKGSKLGTTSWTFIVLFLISFTLLAYYQFYNGKSFHVTFVHSSKAGMSAIDSLKEQYGQSINDNDDLRQKIEQLTGAIRLANARIQELEADTSRSMAGTDATLPIAVENQDVTAGTYYQVQLVALEEYHPDVNSSDLGFYVDKEQGFTKMLVGAFKDESKSLELYKKLRKAGFNDAFIVKKVDGERVPYQGVTD